METNKKWLLSGELGEFLGAFESKFLADRAALEYSDKYGYSKDQIIDYMEENTLVCHIKSAYKWAITKHSIDVRRTLDETEEYALENYKI